MILCDVNVLVYARRRDSPDHERYRDWLEDLVNGQQAYAVADPVLNSFIRLVINPRIFANPTPLAGALEFADLIRHRPHAVQIDPGPRFWRIFSMLALELNLSTKQIPDAYLAALAMEHGCELATADHGFARFPGLRWRHPLS